MRSLPCRGGVACTKSAKFPLSWALLAAVSHVSPAAFSSLCLGLSLPLCPMSAQQPSVISVLGSPCSCVPCQASSLQFSLPWALLAAVSHVRPAAFSSLCLGSPCRCVPCQPSSLQFSLSWVLLAAVSHVRPAASSSLCLGLSLPLCPVSTQQPSVLSVLGSPCRCVPCQPSSLQFPLYWALLAAVSHVSPAAFSSLCLGLFLSLCPVSAQQPSVPSVLGSPCRCASCQPSNLQFPLSWALLAAVPHISPATFSSLCFGLSLLLCAMSAQQPSVPSVLGSPCRCAPCQPSSLQFPLSWSLLVTVPHISPAAFSSLCLGLSLSLCHMSAQQPSVPRVLVSPSRCVPGQPSSLQFPVSWSLLVTVPHVSPAAFSSLCLGFSLPPCPMSAQQPSVPRVLVSPCHCAPCQPSSLQFPVSWSLLAAVPHVSPAAFSSPCLGLSLPLCPRSAQQPSVPRVFVSPCRCAPCQPSSLQFPVSWSLLAAVPHVSPAAFNSPCLGLSLTLCPMSAQQPSVPRFLVSPCHCAPCQPSSLQFPVSWSLLVAVPHVSPAAFSSPCLGLSLPLCPMSAQQPSVPRVLVSPCRCAPCQPSSLQFPVSWSLLAAVPHVSPAAFSSPCLGLSLPLCPMSAQQPSVPRVLVSPCRCAPCQPSSLQFPVSWSLLAAVPQVSPAIFTSSMVHLYVVLVGSFHFPILVPFSLAGQWLF